MMILGDHGKIRRTAIFLVVASLTASHGSSMTLTAGRKSMRRFVPVLMLACLPSLALAAERPDWAYPPAQAEDRKSTRLNSSHSQISYAVFCLKKKKKKIHYLSTQNKNNPYQRKIDKER